MDNTTYVPCGPCAFKKLEKKSMVWCPSCGEGLCEACLPHHKASAASRKHNVVVKNLDKVPTILFSMRQTCDEHGLTFDLYCDTHEIPLCSKCIVGHKRCVRILPISYVSRNSKFSTKLWDVEHGIAHILGNIEEIIKKKKENIQTVKDEKLNIENELKKLREKINEHLDNLQSKVLNNIAVIYSQFSLDSENFLSRIDARKRYIESIAQNISCIREFASDLQTFLLTKKLESDFSKEQDNFISELTETDLDEIDLDVTFNSNIYSILASVTSLAEINVIKHQSVLNQMKRDIRNQCSSDNTLSNIRLLSRTPITAPRDSTTNFLRNCIILENSEVLFTDDSENKRLVWFNADGSHKRNIEMRSEPYDIANMEGSTIAVTVPREKAIFMFDLSRNKIIGKIVTRNYCYGLSYQNNTFIVSILDNGIQTLDRHGNILHTIPMNVEKVCNLHTHLDKLYFTEYDSSSVICCDLRGKCVWKFRHKIFGGPLSVCTDNDSNVYVVGYDTDNLIVISSDGKQCVFLLEGKDKLFGPTGIHFHKQNKQLLVCSRFDGQALLYDLVT